MINVSQINDPENSEIIQKRDESRKKEIRAIFDKVIIEKAERLNNNEEIDVRFYYHPMREYWGLIDVVAEEYIENGWYVKYDGCYITAGHIYYIICKIPIKDKPKPEPEPIPRPFLWEHEKTKKSFLKRIFSL